MKGIEHKCIWASFFLSMYSFEKIGWIPRMGLESTSPRDVGSSPIRGIQPIFSEEYVEWKTDAHIHMCINPAMSCARFASEEKSSQRLCFHTLLHRTY